LASAAPLLGSILLLTAGTGLLTSLLGIRAGLEGFDGVVIGLVLSGFHLGYLGGSTVVPWLISRVGHVRVYSGLASLAAASVLMHVIRVDPATWWVSRVVSGVCLSGLFVVAEAWLNSNATNTTRGQLIGAYMVAVTGGLGLGQLLLPVADPAGFAAFVLASVLVSVAVVPVALVQVRVPEIAEHRSLSVGDVWRVAPLAVVASAGSGCVSAAVLSVGAVYGAAVGLSVGRIALLVAAVLVAGLLLQYPLGALSDRTDRRVVIGGASLAAGTASVGAWGVGADRFLGLVAIGAVAGGLAFPLYSLSLAHLNDYLQSAAVVAAGARMVQINGVGAVAGPLVGATVVGQVSPQALFAVLAAVHGTTGVYAFYRITRRDPVPGDERASFVPLPTGATPAVSTLSPDAAAELYPATAGTIEPTAGGVRLAWRERGGGLPVVLVHDSGCSARMWDRAQLDLADRGFRALAYDLRGHGSSSTGPAYDVGAHVEDLVTVLGTLDVARAVLVGQGSGAVIAARFALEHPERVDSLVAVSAEPLWRGRVGRVRPPVDRAVQSAVRATLGRRAAASLEARTVYGRRRHPQLHRLLAEDLARSAGPARALTRRSANREATRLDVGRLPAPILWVRGKRSHPWPREEGVVVVIPGTGHYVALDQPELLADAVTAFVSSLVPALSGGDHSGW
jgi:pimeloyl-ACP methyl ester carboxylesterase/predicted MFS family arabinose efflux permease